MIQKKYFRSCKRWGAALLSFVLFIQGGQSVYANDWDDWMKSSYRDGNFAAGILPASGGYPAMDLVIPKPTPFVLCSELSKMDANVKDKIVVAESQDGQDYAVWIDKARSLGAQAVLLCQPDNELYWAKWRENLSEQDKKFPFVLIRPQELEFLRANRNRKLISERPHEDVINTYSSWGLSSDFVMKPDLIAPGTVWAPFSRLNPDEDPAFGVLEGTSMSTPTVAGAAILVKQFLQKMDNTLKGAELTRAIRTQLQNTALAHRNEQGVLTTPRWQGAGNLDVGLATENPILVSTPYDKLDTESGQGKVNLRDSIRKGGVSENRIQFLLQLKNIADKPVQFKSAEAVLLVDKVSDKKVGYGSQEVARIKLHAPIVPARGMKELPVDIDFSSYLETTMKEIRENSPNGFFVDGFILLEYERENAVHTAELSVPFVGFYGDWMKVPVLERSIYDRTDRKDLPVYGRFSSVLQTGNGDHVAAFRRPYFCHFEGTVGTENVVLGSDWDFNLEDLKAVELEEKEENWYEYEPSVHVERVTKKLEAQNPTVRKDKIAVSLTGNGAKNIRLRSPAMRNWLAAKLILLNEAGEVVLESEKNDSAEGNMKRYKDHGMMGTTSNGNTTDDNGVKRITEFGALALQDASVLKDGRYTIRVQVRPDAFNLHNPVVVADANARHFDDYWQTEEFPLIIDSQKPEKVRIRKEEREGKNYLIFNAEDKGDSGIKSYILQDQEGKELAKSANGEFEIDPSWGNIETLHFKISDYAFNYVEGEIGNNLGVTDVGAIRVNSKVDDPNFTTSYYAVREGDNKTYYDLSFLPVGTYQIYLLNPGVGYVPQEWSQTVEVKKDEEKEITFSFKRDVDREYALNVVTDLTFEMYEDEDEGLKGLKGSSYKIEFTDLDTGIRYIFPPNMRGQSEIHKKIQPGNYSYKMPGLKKWTGKEVEYKSDYENWEIGFQIDDKYEYTSVTPQSSRLPAMESIDTSHLANETLEFYFYVPRPAPTIGTPVVYNKNGESIQEYSTLEQEFYFILHAERKQNPEQFRIKFPDRLANDIDLQENSETSMLIDSYSNTVEINAYAEEFFEITMNEKTGESKVTIMLPELIRQKLENGDELIIQEMDKSWNPYRDNQVILKVRIENTDVVPNLRSAHSDVTILKNNISSGKEDSKEELTNEEHFADTYSKAYLRSYRYERLNDRIGYEQAWKQGFRGTGMMVAVIDNGIEFAHPSFKKAAPDSSQNKFVDADAVSSRIAKAQSGEIGSRLRLRGRYINEKIAYAYNYLLDSSSEEDMIAGGDVAYEHGAHVSGTATANPFYEGYPKDLPPFAGIAPEAQLAMLSVAASDGQKAESVSYYSQAIYDAVALGADVISASLGFGAGTSVNVNDDFREAVAYAESQGVPVFFAAGNSGYFTWTERRGGETLDKQVAELVDVYAHPYAENPDYGTMDAPAVYDGVVSVGGYGANLFPVVDNHKINPEIESDTYSRPYFGAFKQMRLYLTPLEDVKSNEETEISENINSDVSSNQNVELESVTSENINSDVSSNQNVELESKTSENINPDVSSNQNVELESKTSKNIKLAASPNQNMTLESKTSKNINSDASLSQNVELESKTSKNINSDASLSQNMTSETKTSKNINPDVSSNQNMTSKYKISIKNKKLPTTGEYFEILQYCVVLLLSGIFLAGFIFKRKKEK